MLLFVSQLLLSACSDLEKPKTEPYYSGTAAPRRHEFRWSNGRTPKSVDPAFAMAPPETDIVRALYEGLTELSTSTLEPVPAAAESWTSTPDFRSWTFNLRRNARWSNGKPVTAEDFVRSWKRIGDLAEAPAHRGLLANIVGFRVKKERSDTPSTQLVPDSNLSNSLPPPIPDSTRSDVVSGNSNVRSEPGPAPLEFGVSAPDQFTLNILLTAPDKDFPKLVAHPIFRPVYDEGSTVQIPINEDLVTNGPFRISSIDAEGIAVVRSQQYWNHEAVRLESAKFISSQNAEDVLAAYRAGEIDAITNVVFEPLALKLLEPFQDFRRRTHAALNFYEVNHDKSPFDDRRVREALSISIERERLTEGETEGVTTPALSFLPFGGSSRTTIVQDKERARDLFEEAGFPNGENFPVVRLVVNRNDTQQRVARAVARMWKQNLNVSSEIIVKDLPELEAARSAGDFDLVRRNVVFPTADELMSMLAILEPAGVGAGPSAEGQTPANAVEARPADSSAGEGTPSGASTPDIVATEVSAVYEHWAIPLYFPTSYSLVKPYVTGFEINSLDAPLLTHVVIDTGWQPK